MHWVRKLVELCNSNNSSHLLPEKIDRIDRNTELLKRASFLAKV